MSFFISFEGGEGSGKSTQARILSERLTSMGFAVAFIHEPGSTELGWYVRDWLKRGLPNERTISDHAELLLFSAARAELVWKVFRPILARLDGVIIADRYVDSTRAYQGYGRRIPMHQVEVVNALATHGIMPDLTLLLDIAPAAGLARMGPVQYGFSLDEDPHSERPLRHMEGGRFEDEPMDFHERVRQGYLDLATEESDRWRILDATQPIDRISELVWEAACRRFPRLASQHQEIQQ